MKNTCRIAFAATVLFLPAVLNAEKLFDFETGEQLYQKSDGDGTIAFETRNPLTGKASLRMELGEKSTQMKAVSPSFQVKPSCIYAISWKAATDIGTIVDASLLFKTNGLDYEYNTTRTDGNQVLAATFADVNSAKLAITLRIPGKALGRKAVLDDIAVRELSAISTGESENLVFNPSFEIQDAFPPPLWGFWVKEPQFLSSQDRPLEGRYCLEVRNGEFIIPPEIPVKSGCLYNLKYWIRGECTIYAGLHKLDSQGKRIGWAAPLVKELKLEPDKWRLLEFITASESSEIASFNPYICPRNSTVFIDGISARRIAP